jgi:hypothetical protein
MDELASLGESAVAVLGLGKHLLPPFLLEYGIHMESDSDNTFYRIFTRIRIRMFPEYEYKTDVSNSETHSNIYSI